jgi:4-amino-4-deoxy-L-arabinose transferase-like glycosyltransferase
MDDFMRFLKSNKFQRPPTHIILLVFVLCYFFVFGVFMAHIGGQPDSVHHAHYSSRFSETWGIPEEDLQSPFTFTGQPYLYYWLLGAVTKISQIIFAANPINPGLIWRLTSVIMSMGTVLYSYKLVKKVTENPYAGVIGAFFLSNTLMFVFISGGVNYDNLMNLASMAAIYHLTNIYKHEDFVRNTSLMGLWLSLAALTKKQSLLLAFLLFVVWMIYIIRNFKQIRLNFNKTNRMIVGLLIIGIALFLGLYGINYIRYSSLTPGCRTIKPSEVCTRFAGRSGDYSPVNYHNLWFNRNYFPENPFYYLLNFWFPHFLKSTWGIISHNTFAPMLSTALHGVLIIWGFLCIARYWKKEDKLQSALLIILAAYLLYLFIMNYNTELQTNFLHYGIQGRYAFPVVGIFIALVLDYFLKIRSATIKQLTLSLAIILYFAGGLGVFLFRYAEVFIHWRIYL